MKLELTLPERPGFLHVLPVCDLFLMLWVLFFLGSALMRQTGIAVELPVSQFQLERFHDAEVITLSPGESAPRIYIGRDAVDELQLRQRLERLHDQGAQADTVILLRTDSNVPSGVQRRVQEMALSLGFKVALLGSKDEAPGPAEPATTDDLPAGPGEPQPASD